MDALRQDLRFALRLLWRDRVFALVAVLTLALGIGATTAVFSVAYQVLLRPLPYPEPDRLVQLWKTLSPKDPVKRARLNEQVWPTLADLEEWKGRAGSFERFEGYVAQEENLLGAVPERLKTGRATAGLLPLLGARYELGAGWGPEATVPGHERVAVISHALWSRRFGSSPSALGATLDLGGELYSVVGVLPDDFAFGEAELWRPLVLTAADAQDGGVTVIALGQLRSGVTVAEARSELAKVEDELRADHPERRDYTGIRATPLHEQLVSKAAEPLWLLIGVVVLLLVIACVNVGNLQLARASVREHEVQVRAALGPTAGRLFRQFLSESALLAIAGAALGLLVAGWAVDLLRFFVPPGLLAGKAASGLSLDPFAVLGAVGLGLVTTVGFGVLPALQAVRFGSVSRGSRGATSRGRVRALLVAVQVALAIVPLVGAGLMLRTLYALSEVPLGFRPEQVTIGELQFGPPRYVFDAPSEAPEEKRVLGEVLARVRALPGVTEVGAVSALPLGGRDAAMWVDVQGQPDAAAKGVAGLRAVSAGYFEALQVPLLQGRGFGPEDRRDSTPVALVNAAFAKRYFGTESPLGKQIRLGGEKEAFDVWHEVVGVVGDLRHKKLDQEPGPELYFPFTQFALPRMFLVARSNQSAEALAPRLREQVGQLDSTLVLSNVKPMSALVERETERRAVLGGLFSALAAIGVLLAMVGLYGVVAYSVERRARELAIRLALGARGDQVVALVLGQGLWLALGGVAAGVLGALGLTRALRGLLYGIAPADPLTFVALPLLLLAVAALASWLPARKVARLDPQEALRAE